MAERNHPPNSAACLQWQMLMADALDGLLAHEDRIRFSAHQSVCPACAALFQETLRGRQWLEFLSPDPQVPTGLLDKILARTGPGKMETLVPANSVEPQPWPRPAFNPGFMDGLPRSTQPPRLMTAAMAFFSIALTLNLIGVHFSAVRLPELRPSNMRSIPGEARSFLERRLTMASTPVIRYYDHSRLVYEVESKVRELRRATQSENENRRQPNETSPGESKQIPAGKRGGTRENSRLQPDNSPAGNNSRKNLDASLKFQEAAPAPRLLPKNTMRTELDRRSTAWTA